MGSSDGARTVYVLGAGFSKSISSSTPTMENLSTALLSEDISGYPFLRRYLGQYLEAVGDSLEYRTVERISTALFGTELFDTLTVEHFIEGARLELLRWIASKIHAAQQDISPERAAILRRFLRDSSVLAGERFDSIGHRVVSLNYDLLLESIIDRFNRTTSRGIRWTCDYHIELATLQAQYSVEPGHGESLVFPYLKLHGSLNWFRAAGADRNDVSSVLEVSPGSVLEKVHQADPPVFVPMAHTRRAFLGGTLFPTLWREMTYYLNLANDIIFIGYGFPDTDFSLLLEFARHKARVRTIVISETERAFERKSLRLRTIFPGSEIVNRDAVEWIGQRITSPDPAGRDMGNEV